MLGAMLASLVVAALALAGASPQSIDDGFITLVYARHFAETGRIFWNTDAPSVDGFTSVLDMVTKAFAIRLFPADPVMDAHALAIVLDLGAVVVGCALAFWAARAAGGLGTLTAALGALAFGANLALAEGTSYLLETPLYTLLALAALGLVLFGDAAASRARQGAIAVVLILLALARPEGGPLALVLGLALACAPGGRRAVAPVVGLVAGIVAYYTWHRVHYGYLAPNAYYAKTSDLRWNEVKDGFAYVVDYSAGLRGVALLLVVATLPVAFMPAAWKDRAARRRFAIGGACTLVALAEVIWEGGDSYPGGRFLAVPVALGVAALAVGASGLAGSWGAVAIVPLAVFFVEGARHVVPHFGLRLERIARWPERLDDDPRMACEAQLARVLVPRIATLAESDFQRIKWHADGIRVIDLVGLNDAARAHAPHARPNRWGKFDVRGVLETHADVLALGLSFAAYEPSALFSMSQIVSDPERTRKYIGISLPQGVRDRLVEEYRPLSVPVCGAYHFNLFVRNDVAERFADAQVLVGPSR
jgi:hypothetical protein